MSDAPLGLPATSLQPSRDAILARLRTHPRMNGVQVFDGQLTNGATPDTIQGLVSGYVCVVFGGRGKVRLGWQGITGTRNNLRSWVIGVEVFGRDFVAIHRIADDVFDILEGYEPPACAELENSFSGKIANPVNTMASFSREGMGMLFDTTLDTGTVE